MSNQRFRRRRAQPDYYLQRLDLQSRTIESMSERLNVEGRINDRQDTTLTDLQALVEEQDAQIALLKQTINELWAAVHAAHSHLRTGASTAKCAAAAVEPTSC